MKKCLAFILSIALCASASLFSFAAQGDDPLAWLSNTNATAEALNGASASAYGTGWRLACPPAATVLNPDFYIGAAAPVNLSDYTYMEFTVQSVGSATDTRPNGGVGLTSDTAQRVAVTFVKGSWATTTLKLSVAELVAAAGAGFNPASVSGFYIDIQGATSPYNCSLDLSQVKLTGYKASHNITATSGSNGSVSPAGTSKVYEGDSLTYTITPNAGYEVESVLVDGEPATVGAGGGTYMFENVTAPHTISATFKAADPLFWLSKDNAAAEALNGASAAVSGTGWRLTCPPAATVLNPDFYISAAAPVNLSNYTYVEFTMQSVGTATDTRPSGGFGLTSDPAQRVAVTFTKGSWATTTLKLSVAELVAAAGAGFNPASVSGFYVDIQGATSPYTCSFDLSQVKLTGYVVPIDKAALQTLYDTHKDKAKGNYTDTSWSNFQTKLAAALAALNNGDATQEQVDTAKSELEAAVNALVAVDKSALQTLYDTHKDKAKGSYTDTSWSNFQTKLAAALAALNNGDATQEQADTAKSELEAAVNALVAVDKAALQTLYDAHKDKAKGDYTDASWNNFQAKLAAALAVLDNGDATQAQADTAKSELEAAVNALVAVDKAALQTLYDAHKDKAKGDYTDTSWSNFQAKLAAALAVLDDGDATQTQADTAKSELEAAVNALVSADKSTLQTLYDTHKDKAKGNYTDASWNNFQAKLAAALAVLNNASATQAQLDAAKSELEAAAAALENPAEEPSGGEETPPKTGDPLTAGAALVMLCALSVLAFGSRRKKARSQPQRLSGR